MNAPANQPVPCKSCRRLVYWAHTPAGKRMPVDAEPSEGGRLVLTYSRRANRLLVEQLQPAKHEATRRRYLSHFVTCPHADHFRRPAAPAAASGLEP